MDFRTAEKGAELITEGFAASRPGRTVIEVSQKMADEALSALRTGNASDARHAAVPLPRATERIGEPSEYRGSGSPFSRERERFRDVELTKPAFVSGYEQFGLVTKFSETYSRTELGRVGTLISNPEAKVWTTDSSKVASEFTAATNPDGLKGFDYDNWMPSKFLSTDKAPTHAISRDLYSQDLQADFTNGSAKAMVKINPTESMDFRVGHLEFTNDYPQHRDMYSLRLFHKDGVFPSDVASKVGFNPRIVEINASGLSAIGNDRVENINGTLQKVRDAYGLDTPVTTRAKHFLLSAIGR